MLSLTHDEARVLGVLIEKAQTTPNQYPLTLNALATGCSQKNNRDPVDDYNEDRAYDALASLRKKGLVVEAMLSGSRVSKFRHVARDLLKVSTHELIILAELWLRGPQSPGELRSNASRMAPPDQPLSTLDQVQSILDALAAREPSDSPAGGPMVARFAPAPGERAARFGQTLCPELNSRAGAASSSTSPAPSTTRREPDDRIATLEKRVEALERELASLKALMA